MAKIKLPTVASEELKRTGRPTSKVAPLKAGRLSAGVAAKIRAKANQILGTA